MVLIRPLSIVHARNQGKFQQATTYPVQMTLECLLLSTKLEKEPRHQESSSPMDLCISDTKHFTAGYATAFPNLLHKTFNIAVALTNGKISRTKHHYIISYVVGTTELSLKSCTPFLKTIFNKKKCVLRKLRDKVEIA